MGHPGEMIFFAPVVVNPPVDLSSVACIRPADILYSDRRDVIV